jgi:symplekin
VPRHHPLIPPPNLEAEASGLLDRLLSAFQENSRYASTFYGCEPRIDNHSDAILINATLNGLSVLIRTRPAVANKILSAILNFNPLKQANSPMTPRLRVMVKSMERTTRALLINTNKR